MTAQDPSPTVCAATHNGAPGESEIFGGFVPCPVCDGYGAVCIAGVAGRWDETPYDNDREEPCTECEGFGTVFQEDDR